jgi:hypothetical protein
VITLAIAHAGDSCEQGAQPAAMEGVAPESHGQGGGSSPRDVDPAPAAAQAKQSGYKVRATARQSRLIGAQLELFFSAPLASTALLGVL